MIMESAFARVLMVPKFQKWWNIEEKFIWPNLDSNPGTLKWKPDALWHTSSGPYANTAFLRLPFHIVKIWLLENFEGWFEEIDYCTNTLKTLLNTLTQIGPIRSRGHEFHKDFMINIILIYSIAAKPRNFEYFSLEFHDCWLLLEVFVDIG